MKVQEYVAKDILRAEGVGVPKSILILRNSDLQDYVEALKKLGFPQVAKAQVLVGGRMKAGGVLVSKTIEQAISNVSKIMDSEIKGEIQEGVLVEEFVPHESEHYISITIDRSLRDIVFVYSSHGGIDIEEFTKTHPEEVVKTKRVNDLPLEVRAFARRLYDIFVKYDLTLLEINPFVESNGYYYALDAVFHVDDSALYRQWWAGESSVEDSFVVLGGDVGVIGCGAGIVMATTDALTEHGFKPANFCDIGGGATADTLYSALTKVQKITNKAVLNIFGGITDCLEIAKGVTEFKTKNPGFEIYIRLSGNNEILAKKLLEESGIVSANDMKELIESVDRRVKGVRRDVVRK